MPLLYGSIVRLAFVWPVNYFRLEQGNTRIASHCTEYYPVVVVVVVVVVVTMALRIVLCYWCVSGGGVLPACVRGFSAWAPWCVSRLTNSCCCSSSDHSRIAVRRSPHLPLFFYPLCTCHCLFHRSRERERERELRGVVQTKIDNNIHIQTILLQFFVFPLCRNVQRFFFFLFTQIVRAPRNIDRTAAGSPPAGHGVIYNTAHFPIVEKSRRRSTAAVLCCSV